MSPRTRITVAFVFALLLGALTAGFVRTRSTTLTKTAVAEAELSPEMERLLKEGGKLLWIAPAGGRDRCRDGVLAPDAFDAGAVEMVRRLGTKKGSARTHYYPFAMATYNVMPPPEKLEKSLGEKREVRFTGVGLSLGAEVDVSDAGDWAKGLGAEATAEERQAALALAVHASVSKEFQDIQGCMGTGAPFPLPPQGARPWLQ